MDDDALSLLFDEAEGLAWRLYMLWWCEPEGTPRARRLLALERRAWERQVRRERAVTTANSPP
jgi:hypothetical protein